jgi:signal transduction histidine kinase
VTKSPFEDLRHRIGGESLFDVRGLLVLLVPVSFFTSILTRELSDLGQVVAWSIGNLIGFLVATVLILLLESLRKRFSADKPLPITLVLLLSFGLGFFKATFTNLGANLILAEPVEVLDVRPLFGGIAGLVGIPLTALIISYLMESQAQRDRLLHVAYQKAASELTSRRELGQLDDLMSQLRKLRSSLEMSFENSKVSEGDLALLRDIVDRRVRPLSASLYGEIEKRHPSFEFKSLFLLALRSSPPALAIATYFLLAMPYFILAFGLPDGIALGLLSPVFMFLGFIVLYFMVGKLKAGRQAAFLIVAAIVPVMSVASAGATLSINFSGKPFLLPLIAGWMLQTTVVFSGIKQAIALTNRNREELEGLDEETGFFLVDHATLSTRRRQFANQLHGEVQSRLMTLLLRGRAGQELKSELVIRELDLIEQLIQGHSQESAESLEQGLQGLVQQWRGVAEISISGIELVGSGQNAIALLQLVDQAVTNAIRHGLATKVSVMFTESNSDLVLLVEDDGIGPARGKPGLGSRLFESSSSKWELLPSEAGGSVLTIRF